MWPAATLPLGWRVFLHYIQHASGRGFYIIYFNYSHRYTYIIVSMTLFIDLLHDYLNMSLGFIHGKWGSHGWTRGPFTLIVAVASGLQ